jgi:hypothetical protein
MHRLHCCLQVKLEGQNRGRQFRIGGDLFRQSAVLVGVREPLLDALRLSSESPPQPSPFSLDGQGRRYQQQDSGGTAMFAGGGNDRVELSVLLHVGYQNGFLPLAGASNAKRRG